MRTDQRKICAKPKETCHIGKTHHKQKNLRDVNAEGSVQANFHFFLLCVALEKQRRWMKFKSYTLMMIQVGSRL